MIEPTREQDRTAEAIATRFGSCRVELRPDGFAQVIALPGSRWERGYLVAADGTASKDRTTEAPA